MFVLIKCKVKIFSVFKLSAKPSASREAVVISLKPDNIVTDPDSQMRNLPWFELKPVEGDQITREESVVKVLPVFLKAIVRPHCK